MGKVANIALSTIGAITAEPAYPGADSTVVTAQVTRGHGGSYANAVPAKAHDFVLTLPTELPRSTSPAQ